MSPQIPVEDPSQHDSLAERSASYVRRHPLLRGLLIATVIDHAAAVVLVLTGHMTLVWAGYLVLLSVFAWFFAVPLPLMNRVVRAHAGVDSTGYWGELVEMFGRVVLFAMTAAYTFLLVWAALSSGG